MWLNFKKRRFLKLTELFLLYNNLLSMLYIIRYHIILKYNLFNSIDCEKLIYCSLMDKYIIPYPFYFFIINIIY